MGKKKYMKKDRNSPKFGKNRTKTTPPSQIYRFKITEP